MQKPVCVVVGVGIGNGEALARRFSQAGFALALLARGLDVIGPLASELGNSKAYQCDVSNMAEIEEVFAQIMNDLGQITVVIYNAGSGMWGNVEEITTEQFEASWRVNALGLLTVSKQVIPAMKQAGAGQIIVIGATASKRGNIKTAAFAPAKAAQRSLAESMARSLWPAGIHVALIIIDGMVDLPKTRAMMPDKPDDAFVKPVDVAETAFWLSQQARSAWSFEVEVRPYRENW